MPVIWKRRTPAASSSLTAFKDRLKAGVVGLISKEPYRDFARAAALMVPAGVKLRGTALSTGISPAAHIDPTAALEEGVTVEPGAIIGAGAAIGSGSTICAGAVVAHDVQVGRDCYVGAQAVVQHALIGDRVILHSGVNIGQDGFGFAMSPMGHLKVPQLGRVIVQDDVEIGAGSCIDRGTTRDTVIGEGTKIDNLVQIGHNVESVATAFWSAMSALPARRCWKILSPLAATQALPAISRWHGRADRRGIQRQRQRPARGTLGGNAS
jgi:UDP-3-O-[3-hydroxymyristoyl] glucosamine N-acyltransferase LpxD